MAEAIPSYDELKLRLEKEEATSSYRVLAFGPHGRVGRGTFMSPFTDDELDDFVRGVGLARRTRRSASERMEKAKSFGAELFGSLMKEQVGEVYQAARAAAQANDRGLRITLFLSGAPELMRLPWEFLYRRPRFLSQSIRTPLVRSLDLESARPPRKVKLPLRILGIVSSPAGYEELDADAERHKLEHAVRKLSDGGLVELHWLERPTLAELERRIAEPDEIHVLHYIGHGAYDEATERGIVVLESARHRPHDVTGEEIGAMLQDEESLHLVVLNSCEGARTSHVDPFSGAAASLVEFEIPAVIGMQFEITDEAAIAFSDRLYTALAQGLPVDAALAQARRAIVAAGKETEFATPVLFLRGADARIFDVQPPSDPRLERIGEERGDLSPAATRPGASTTEVPRRVDWSAPQQLLQVQHPRDERIGTRKILGVALSPDARRLATGSDDNTARVWELSTGRQLLQLDHPGSVTSVAFSSDGRLLATTFFTSVRVWELPSSRQLLQVDHQNTVYGVALSPDGLELATAGGSTARVWELASGRRLLQLDHEHEVRALSISANWRYLATGSAGYGPLGSSAGAGPPARGSGRVWELPSGEQLLQLDDLGPVHGVALSPDGRQLATASYGTRVWELPSGRHLLQVDVQRSGEGIAFSPDGRRLATASFDTACVWELPSGRQLFLLHDGGYVRPAFSDDGRYLATAGPDGSARVWELPSARQLSHNS
jgi:WD40 repeat protein